MVTSQEIIDNAKNEDLKSLITKKENLDALEYLINEESRDLKEAKNIGGKRHFVASLADLREESENIFNIVRDFYGVENSDSPSISRTNFFTHGMLPTAILSVATGTILYFTPDMIKIISHADSLKEGLFPSLMLPSLYAGDAFLAHKIFSSLGFHDMNKKNILVPYASKIKQYPLLGHEFTHNLAVGKLGKEGFGDTYLLQEGLARGSELKVASHYADKEDNQRFKFNIIKHRIADMKVAYNFINRKTGFTKVPYLPKNLTEGNYMGYALLGDRTYAIGNSLMILATLNEGEQTYKQVFQGLKTA